ncbi:MAG: hypothetical protein J6W00_14690 [Lentisphaeria bacterium]|nr:hypothetical protein [Lentisphaeria bacterium]
MEYIDFLAKLVSIIATIIVGMIWVVKRIESGQDKMMRRQRVLLKKLSEKVSQDECRDRRMTCQCYTTYTQGEKK